MKKTHQLSAFRMSGLALAAVSAVGLTSASGHKFGEYTTRVAESRLFINGGRILRCDLFFSSPGSETQLAPKGSSVNQSIPPVVWQYSGLLPASDYLKSVAIHSVASDDKIRPWQEVQKSFYDGLRVEGAQDLDAKIAFAGAYSFAPRWPLVELIEVEEETVVFPDTVLYKVEYSQPNRKGMSLERYRNLALQILNRPEDVSLADIRNVVDAADAARTKAEDLSTLGGIGESLFFDDSAEIEAPTMVKDTGGVVVDLAQITESASSDAQPGGVKTIGNTSVVYGDMQMVASATDERAPEKVAAEESMEISKTEEPVTAATLLVDDISGSKNEIEDELAADLQGSDSELAMVSAEQMAAEVEESVEGKRLPENAIFFDDSAVDTMQPKMDKASELAVEIDSVPETSELMRTDEVATIAGKVSGAIKDIVKPMPVGELFYDDIKEGEQDDLIVGTDMRASELDGPLDDWIILPDGTMILRDIETLVQQ